MRRRAKLPVRVVQPPPRPWAACDADHQLIAVFMDLQHAAHQAEELVLADTDQPGNGLTANEVAGHRRFEGGERLRLIGYRQPRPTAAPRVQREDLAWPQKTGRELDTEITRHVGLEPINGEAGGGEGRPRLLEREGLDRPDQVEGRERLRHCPARPSHRNGRATEAEYCAD